MPSSPGGCLQRHDLRDGVAPVAALRHVLRVAEALHQRRPRLRDARRVPAGRGRLAGEAVAGQRRDHEVERVRRGPAVRGGIGQRLDDLQLLDDRAGPPVRDDHRQRVLVLRPDVDEVDVEPVDLGDELRQRRSACASHLAPVVVSSPSSARAPASSPAARPGCRRRRSPARATASPRSRRRRSASSASEAVNAKRPDAVVVVGHCPRLRFEQAGGVRGCDAKCGGAKEPAAIRIDGVVARVHLSPPSMDALVGPTPAWAVHEARAPLG